MADWSDLPEDLLNYIAVRLFSVVELKRFRSICTSWRSSVSVTGNNNLIPRRPLVHFTPILSSFTQENNNVYRFKPGAFLSRAAFFRVTLSSSTSKGWLIKSDVDVNSGRFRLLQAVSRHPLRRPLESLDLLEFTVTEIQETYAVLVKHNGRITSPRFNRSVLVKVKEGEVHHYGVLGIGQDGNITYWNGQVLRIFEQVAQFSDIIVHKGLTYALDSQGIVWLISSDLEISRYGPSLNENITNGCYGDMRFVECCGEVYIVERLPKGNLRKRKVGDPFHCAGFKVYKMDDEELGRLIEVKSLGDNAFIMATDTCFSVLAHEFYGCMQNSIYFTEDKEIKVFKLDNSNGSIATKSEFPGSFQMFVPSFLRFFV